MQIQKKRKPLQKRAYNYTSAIRKYANTLNYATEKIASVNSKQDT